MTVMVVAFGAASRDAVVFVTGGDQSVEDAITDFAGAAGIAGAALLGIAAFPEALGAGMVVAAFGGSALSGAATGGLIALGLHAL